MIGTVRVSLFLALMICISEAQLYESGQHCLCNRGKKGPVPKLGIKDIQIYPSTIFCNKVEIIVTMNNGRRICLNPNAVTKLLDSVVGKQSTSTTTRPDSLPL